MLFNSYPFIFVFLPITLIGFFSLTKFRLTQIATAWLVIASLAFYAYWNIAYLPLLLISIAFNYEIGRRLGRAQPKSQPAQLLLGVGITLNLVLLGYYKYAHFFVNSWNHLFASNWTIPPIILPLGISFYTFTQTAYLVDAYRGETKEVKYNWLTYSLFVTFFPHLIAGPILHHKEMIPQFYRQRNFVFSQKNLALGLTLFTLGMFKKVVIADSLSDWVATVFGDANTVTFLEAWAGALSYTFQLYFDFSGYSDMAIGLGTMININLPLNFNSPYKATSISDFWRRWHITLSNFLRDYLYIPLGGNRLGRIRQYSNLLITMLLGGLWHGAGWTFVIWGGIHGIFLVINHWWRKLGIPLPKFLAWTITFFSVLFSWVIFRSHNLSDAMNILKAMTGVGGIVLPIKYQSSLNWMVNFGVQFKDVSGLDSLSPLLNINRTTSVVTSVPFVLSLLMLCVTLLPNTQEIMQLVKPTWLWVTLLSGIAAICLLSLNQVSEFLYFQF